MASPGTEPIDHGLLGWRMVAAVTMHEDISSSSDDERYVDRHPTRPVHPGSTIGVSRLNAVASTTAAFTVSTRGGRPAAAAASRCFRFRSLSALRRWAAVIAIVAPRSIIAR